MPDDFVDPVDGVKSSHRVESGGSRPGPVPGPPRSVPGTVVAVRRRAGHHDGEHVLDTSVGARTYTEVVLRMESDELKDLIGKRVVINFRM